MERMGTTGGIPCQLGHHPDQAVVLPIAKNADGSAITGPAYEYIVTVGNFSLAKLSGGQPGGQNHCGTNPSRSS